MEADTFSWQVMGMRKLRKEGWQGGVQTGGKEWCVGLRVHVLGITLVLVYLYRE